MAPGPTLAEARRWFAEEVRALANVTDARVVDAFATVPREKFVGPGPWRILNLFDQTYWSTPDADPRHVYHSVLIALDEATGLNTGDPSLWAYHLDRLKLQPGQRVLQIGTGSGYFTAILAEIVGPAGCVLGFEIEPRLVEMATANLADWPQASVKPVDGIEPPDGRWDAIIAFAGATAPPKAWVDALEDGGRALIPMTGRERWGFMLRLDRRGAMIAARPVGRVGFFHCAGARDDQEAARLSQALGDPVGQRDIATLRRDPHDRDESCWLHGDGWCLSKLKFN